MTFAQADVLVYDLGTDDYDLVALLGSTLSDFSLESFLLLSRKVHKALKQGVRFIVHYIDGLSQFISTDYPREAVRKEEPQRITRRFKEYKPEEASFTEICSNQATGETCQYTSDIYSPPFVCLSLRGQFERERSVRLSESSYLGIFLKA